jgi:outer membrane biosynthesis protein TonB
MNTYIEHQAKTRAWGYTAAVVTLLLLLFFFIKWGLPQVPEPPFELGLEVNLGNSDEGLGNDQPFLPGQPSAANQQAYTPPRQTSPVAESSKDFVTDDRDPDAPEVAKPPVSDPKSTKVPEKDVVKSRPVENPQPVNNPAPAPSKPKAVFSGVNGTGTGGNEADSYKKGGNEGIAGGSGDQGRPGGNPDSDNYVGGGSGSGVAISTGLQGRRITGLPSFEDNFNQNAKVAMDIKVDASGKVISATYQPRGSTTSDPNYKEIARRKALQIKFNSGEGESVGTIIFNFKVKG